MTPLDQYRDPNGRTVEPDGAHELGASDEKMQALRAPLALPADKASARRTRCEDVEDATDQGDANRLASRHGEFLAYIRGVGWHVYNGCNWEESEAEAGNMSAETSQAYLDKVQAEYNAAFQRALDANGGDEKKAKSDSECRRIAELTVWARGGKNTRRIENCLTRASAHSVLAHDHAEFDADDMLLSVANGTLDVRTATLLDHDPRHKITKISPVEFDPGAECPFFDAFMESSIPDAEERAFLLRYLGYSLTGVTREHVMLFLLGEGRNGKGVFVETIRLLLGDHAASASAASFLQSRDQRSGSAPSSDIARLRGKRLVTVSEVPNGRELNEQFVKGITGEDKITARFLHKDEIEFLPKFKIIWSMNDKPRIVGADHGIWSRIVLMPWRVIVDKPDTLLREKLKRELPGILRRAVAGCLDWQRQGLNPPDSMRAAKDAWREEENEAASFVEECCDTYDAKLDIKTENKVIRAAFDRWCKHTGRSQIPANTFGRKMAQMKCVRVGKSHGKTYYYNIALKKPDSPNDYTAPSADAHDGRWS